MSTRFFRPSRMAHCCCSVLCCMLLASGLLLRPSHAQVVGPFPDGIHSTAVLDRPVVIMVTPGGHGGSLSDQGSAIEIVLRDLNGDVITNYPPDDVFVIGVEGNAAVCPGGTLADGPSDQEGRMTISSAFHAGGWTEAGVHVWAGGAQITEEPLDLRWVSPDMNGDRVINMVDIAEFAIAFAADYEFRADLTRDGVVDLRDLGEFALQFSIVDNFCP